MKNRMMFILCLVPLLFSTAPRAAHAAGVLNRQVFGSIGIETPVGQNPDRPQDNSPQVVGNLHLSNLIGPVGVFGTWQVQWKNGAPYNGENKYQAGLEMPLKSLGMTGMIGDLTVYSYFERRFDTNDNRFMVGCRWGFSHGF